MKIGIKRVLFDSTMDQFTTFRVGGRAEAVCFPTEPNMLQTLICWLNDECIPYLVVGRGSNLLIRDGGYGGVVIILEGGLATIERYGVNEQGLLAGGGLSIVELLSFCSSNGLTGLEFLAGIPGTVGGAVAMNAGAFGKDLTDLVRDIRILTVRGEWGLWDRSRLKFSYRGLELPKGAVIVKIRFQLNREDPAIIRAKITEYLGIRKENQPLEFPSGGSVFKNPPEYYAGKLIEQSGLKGKTIGGAAISLKHANFIINTGNAKAADILALMDLARQKVKDDTGIELEPEIHVEGIDPD